MSNNILQQFKLVQYGTGEGLKKAKKFLPKGAVGDNIAKKLEVESKFHRAVAHEVRLFELNEMDDNDLINLLIEGN